LINSALNFFGVNDGAPVAARYSPLPKMERETNGRFVLKSCKLNSFNIDAGAGKQIVATQWHGVADEIVSLPGPPTALKGNTKDGALDTWPARQANTSLPLAQLKQQERQSALVGTASRLFSAGLRSFLG
jgi:hypothetical protein